MIWGFLSDAVFLCALLLQSVAVLSYCQAAFGTALKAELALAVSAYHDRIAGLAALIPGFGPFPSGIAVVDGALVSGILFFLFTIRQARLASAPEGAPIIQGSELSRAERCADLLVPVVLCALGAFFAGVTLLGLLTPLFAGLIFLCWACGGGCWFRIPRVYIANIVFLAALSLAIALS